MEDRKDLPKPLIDLPLPEKELPGLSATEAAGNGGQAAHVEQAPASKGETLRSYK